MPVEIHFLSGSRQGERIPIDATEFRAGDDRDCQVFFDPVQDPDAQGRAALFRLQDDGWHVQNAGEGELLINDERLTGTRRIRSGDVVRMSDRGPDFTFSLVARAGATPPEAPAPTANSQFDVPRPTTINAATTASARNVSAPAPRAARSWPMTPQWAIGGLAAALLICGLAWLLSGSRDSQKPKPLEPQEATASSIAQMEAPPKPEVAASSVTAPDTRSNAAIQPPAAPPVEKTKPVEPAKPAESQDVKTAAPDHAPAPVAPAAEPATSTPPWREIGNGAGKAVLVLCVEDTRSKSIWPFATATAVSDQLVLTTATVATELARFRQDSNRWNVWACQDPDGERFSLKEIRVHRGYVESGDSPEKKVYFDVALISVEQKLPATLPLASTKTLAELGGGYPLVCVGVSHKSEPINRFEGIQPQSVSAKVFAITVLEPTPSAPRLLHINESIPPNFYGAPLITAEGSVAAVYSTPAASGDDKAAESLHMHYAVVVEPQLIDLWKQGRGDDVWMAPRPGTDPSSVPPTTP